MALPHRMRLSVMLMKPNYVELTIGMISVRLNYLLFKADVGNEQSFVIEKLEKRFVNFEWNGLNQIWSGRGLCFSEKNII